MNITKLQYPCYVGPIIEGALHHIHIPKLTDLLDVQEYVTFYCKSPNLEYVWIYDLIPIDDWNRRKCNKTYGERLRNVREFVNMNREAGFYDLPMALVTNPGELLQEQKDLLTEGSKGIIIYSEDLKYDFKGGNNSCQILK